MQPSSCRPCRYPPASTLGDVLLLVNVTYEDSSRDQYQLPLAFTSGTEAEIIRRDSPQSIIVNLATPTGPAILHDASVREDLRAALLALVAPRSLAPRSDRRQRCHRGGGHDRRRTRGPSRAPRSKPTRRTRRLYRRPLRTNMSSSRHRLRRSLEGTCREASGHPASSTDATAPHSTSGSQIVGSQSSAFEQARGTGALQSRIGSAEQSNTNFVFGDKLMMKLFRRVQPGLNPDVEIGRFLTESANWPNGSGPRIAPFPR